MNSFAFFCDAFIDNHVYLSTNIAGFKKSLEKSLSKCVKNRNIRIPSFLKCIIRHRRSLHEREVKQAECEIFSKTVFEAAFECEEAKQLAGEPLKMNRIERDCNVLYIFHIMFYIL
ncbi:hypothetical protein NPIL_516191 [Nephila pilipes]|uniref:Uncharacterized protein n=1 Tax=Nephila pilipes TaxID=299642 RepID=A0A8X6Q0F7_NEPPI|nr:hypothetical protein NPIL_516191 [Nephila pilipes]